METFSNHKDSNNFYLLEKNDGENSNKIFPDISNKSVEIIPNLDHAVTVKNNISLDSPNKQFEDEESLKERTKIKKKTLPKTNSFGGPSKSIVGQTTSKIQPKPSHIFKKALNNPNLKKKEEAEIQKILIENARKKYIRDLWINNFLIIAMFIKKFIETLKSINIVSKFLRMTQYHYNIIEDKVYFYESFDASIKQQWFMPSKTTKRFVRENY